MKIAYVGGGSFRVLPEVRGLLSQCDLAAKIELALYDLDAERVNAMAALIRRTPEACAANTRVTVADTIDAAVEGADFVEITACPWSGDFYRRCIRASNRQGLLASDNVSPTGAFLALHSANLALKVARRMEALAPHGTLICFTNPIALLAGTVLRGTSIRAVGICAGQANYVHNVAYIMGWPDYDWDLDAEVAGINHVSWLMGLTLRGHDMMPEFTRQLAGKIDYDRLKHIGNYRELCVQFPRLAYAWKQFGVVHYSLEPEGLPLLCFYQEELDRQKPVVAAPPPTAPLDALATTPKECARSQQVADFLRIAAANELPAVFWERDCPVWLKTQPFKANTGARVIRGLTSDAPETMATSYLNRGAVAGFPDDAIMEYSTRYVSGRIEKHATYRLPPVIDGLTHMLVEHQTLTCDAILAEDPDLFRKALYAFPTCRSRQAIDAFVNEVLSVNRNELPTFICP